MTTLNVLSSTLVLIALYAIIAASIYDMLSVKLSNQRYVAFTAIFWPLTIPLLFLLVLLYYVLKFIRAVKK